jgi:hypothetical protein
MRPSGEVFKRASLLTTIKAMKARITDRLHRISNSSFLSICVLSLRPNKKISVDWFLTSRLSTYGCWHGGLLRQSIISVKETPRVKADKSHFYDGEFKASKSRGKVFTSMRTGGVAAQYMVRLTVSYNCYYNFRLLSGTHLIFRDVCARHRCRVYKITGTGSGTMKTEKTKDSSTHHTTKRAILN